MKHFITLFLKINSVSLILGLEILEIVRYQDNVYLVNAIQESLWVLFDGKNAEISGSTLLRSRSCGLCGDLNGENTADLKTPERYIFALCIMKIIKG